MKLQSLFRAACVVRGLVCLGIGCAATSDGRDETNSSLRTRPERVVAGKTLGASPADSGATEPTAKRTSWISPELPKPDSAGWLHLFDGQRLYGCTPEASDLQSGRVRLEGRLLRLDSAILHFNVDANDLEVRARLKKVSGEDLKLTVRNTTAGGWRGCATFFYGGNRFRTGKNDGTEFKPLAAGRATKPYDDFFNLEVVALGDELRLKADDEEIYNAAGSSVDYGGVRFAAEGGTTLFERIEVRILDKDTNAQERLVSAVLTNFTRWDKNGDGELQEQEITRATQDSSVQGDAAAATAALKRLLASSEKGVQVPALTAPFFQSAEPLVGRCASEFRDSLKRMRDSAGLPVFAANSPTLSECRQRGLGDCYLVAVLGAAIDRDPGTIRGMITSNSNSQAKGYRVSFPDGTRVDVPGLTDGELAWMGPGTARCLWQRLLEKAWGLRKICRSHGAADPSIEPFDTVSGGSGENMLLSMTGHETVDYYLGVRGHEVTPLDTLRAALKETFRLHRLAEAFTWKATGSYFPPNHAYALLGYDAASDSVRLWNPLGNDFAPSGSPDPRSGYNTVGGQFTMPLRDLPAVFAHVRTETGRRAVIAGPKVFP